MATKTVPTSRWTVEEVAFLLNYVDECLHDKKDYKSTITAALMDQSGREATLNSINRKIGTYLRDCNPKVSFAEFVQQGIRCLDAHVIPAKLSTAMRKQRPQRLGDTHFRDTAESSNNIEGVQSSRNRGIQKSYRESSIPDSNASSENLADAEYVNGSADIDSTTPGSNTANVLQTVKRQSGLAPTAAANGADGAYSKAAGKRKASVSEVVDLANDSAPPLKRQAHGQRPSATTESSIARSTQLRQETPRIFSPKYAGSEEVTYNRKTGAKQMFWTRELSANGGALELQSDIETLQAQVNHLSCLVMFKMKRDLSHNELSDREISIVLNAISAGKEEEPASMAKKLIDHAKSARAAKNDMLEIVRGAFRRHDPGTTLKFPPVPFVQEVSHGWREARRGVKEAFSNELDFLVEGLALDDVTAGYVACTIDQLMEDPRPRKDLIPSLDGYNESPHAAQALTSALFCRWVFATPDGMCEGQHHELQLMQYRTVMLSDGLSDVQRLDKIAFSSFFADKNFQTTTLRTVTEKFLKRFDMIKQVCPAAPGIESVRGSSDWAEGLLKLKQRLMISPHDYRVHFCHPGVPFDATWMVAEDYQGEPVHPDEIGSMKVRICLFPALVEQDPKDFEASQTLEDALIKNKNFLPSWQDRKAFDAKRVVGKATVFVA
ncbi:hypothetical protein T440DRAFT_549042 [Plenodomus tracheiphilus IPT5]|uniref:Uncharacterized protein n=1 Tax=Plenodomus tracheiphilus IPT5 TaxID=1408161 RepID=A0A6A7BGT4_9PLEO|nr:hypothetical protein T440DRAFT_549042 [Plenodomus tracheiphilus IPT5]